MRTLNLNIRFRNIFTLVLSLMVLSTTTFATEISKMEPMPIKPVISSDFGYIITALSEDVVEETLFVEEWMLNPEAFLTEEIQEPLLAVEEWMTDVDAFLPEVNEPELALKSWMTDVDAFINEKNESELELEMWMTNVESFIISEQILALK